MWWVNYTIPYHFNNRSHRSEASKAKNTIKIHSSENFSYDLKYNSIKSEFVNSARESSIFMNNEVGCSIVERVDGGPSDDVAWHA